MSSVNWKEQFKVRIANSDPSFQHHEVVKLLLVMKLLQKNKSNRHWIRIYTEFFLENGLKPDVYFEDVKDKSVIIYEIQKEYSKQWLEEKTEKYNSLEIPFFPKVTFIPIDLRKLSKNIEELNEQLEDYVF